MPGETVKKFEAVQVSTKFGICGMPIRVDSYRGCSFGCKYCFANFRVYRAKKVEFAVADYEAVERKLDLIFNKNKAPDRFLNRLIRDRITWHYGGLSDPFQSCEAKYQITKRMVEISNRFNISILFSTKSDTTYDVPIKPEFHSFQLSVAHTGNDSRLEDNLPEFESRIKFFNALKKRGFKVGIRIQPFIPGVTNLDIIDTFKSADYFTIEGLKLVPDSHEQRKYFVDLLHLPESYWENVGLLNIKPYYRYESYQPFIAKLEAMKLNYSIADNDMRYFTKGKCCCGDPLIHKSNDLNTTAFCFKYGKNWTSEDIKVELKNSGLGNYKIRNLFPQDRQQHANTVYDFFINNQTTPSNPVSNKFMYTTDQLSLFNLKPVQAKMDKEKE